MLQSPATYAQQLQEKIVLTEQQFSGLYSGPLDVFHSHHQQYRMRAEFKMWHSQNQVHYAMYKQGEYKTPYIVEEFVPGSATIQQLMPSLLERINENDILKHKLFQAEFLTSLQGEALITLIYHKKLDVSWEQQAKSLANSLGCHLIGRSKGQKLVIGEDYITEHFEVAGESYHYQQVEASFTQPNGKVCEYMLNWAIQNCIKTDGDLLELYCGNGNFTLPLAKLHNKVLATEISKTSIRSATFNCQLNQIDNIDFVRLSSEELTQALNKEREFNRLKHLSLDDFNFKTVFVDPPRAGLDEGTRDLVCRFENIIYISCNPDTLERDLKTLTQHHQITKMALFDQFPYTHHRECGAILCRK